MRIGRREFLAGVGGLGVGLCAGRISYWFPLPQQDVLPDWHAGQETFVPSTCMLCPAHCGIRGRLVDGKLVRVDGNPLHPVSRGGLCAKGRAGIQLLYHPGRITTPIERVGPPGSTDFRPISWEDALDRVATAIGDRLAAGDAHAIAWLEGDVSGALGDVTRRFTGALGGARHLREDYDDGSGEVMRMTQGIASSPAFDLDGADLVVSFGAPLSESWWGLLQAARARDAAPEERPHWVQIDVRHSRTAARADEWIGVKPGTYGLLAMGIAYVLLKEGLYDEQWVHTFVQGMEDTQEADGALRPGLHTLVLRYGRTEEISRQTGVPVDRIVRLAKAMGTARRAVAVWDHAVSWRTGGMADALAIHALNTLLGAPGRPGGLLVQPPLPASLPGAPPPGDGPGGASRGGAPAGSPGGPGTRDGAWTAANWASRVAAAAPGSDLQVLFLHQANPAASAPDAAAAREALSRIPLVVSFSPFLDESARFANLVLPDSTYLERWQDAPGPATVPYPVWGIVQPVVPPLHDTRATGDVVLALAKRLGEGVARELPWDSMEDLVHARGKALAAETRGAVFQRPFRREELREMEGRGWWVSHGLSAGAFWDRIRETGGWFDPRVDTRDRSAFSRLPDGKIRVYPVEARERLRATVAGLTEGFLPVAEAETPEPRDRTLLLHPYRVMTLAAGGTALMPWLLENLGLLTGDSWETWAEIHPETARELGLSPGQRVRVASEAGSFVAVLRGFEGAQPGVLSVPYGLHTAVEGWGQAAGANPLAAVGRRVDPASGLPDWYSTRVRVTPA